MVCTQESHVTELIFEGVMSIDSLVGSTEFSLISWEK